MNYSRHQGVIVDIQQRMATTTLERPCQPKRNFVIIWLVPEPPTETLQPLEGDKVRITSEEKLPYPSRIQILLHVKPEKKLTMRGGHMFPVHPNCLYGLGCLSHTAYCARRPRKISPVRLIMITP